MSTELELCVAEARAAWRRHFSDDTWVGAGPHLTCSETEALAGLLEAVGLDEFVDGLLVGHGLADEDINDQHHHIYLAGQEVNQL